MEQKPLNERLRALAHECGGTAFWKVEHTLDTPWLTVRLVYGVKHVQTVRADVDSLDKTFAMLLEEAEADMGLYEPQTMEEVKAS